MTDRPAAARAGGAEETGAWPMVAVVCGYFLSQVLYRRLLSGGLALDEAQMFLWSQRLAWGYGPQPPLYSWLQWAVFRVVPDPLLGLSLLKNAFLATTYLSVYALLSTAHPRGRAGLAALSLFLVPQVSWDSQRDMTHSVLVVTLAALATLAFWTRTLPGRPWGWALFGLLVGLGPLAKPNFLIVPLALLLAAASFPETRGRLRPSGIALALGVAAAVWAMPLRWVRLNPDLAYASVHKLQRAGGVSVWESMGAGILAFGLALLGCLALATVVLAVIRWRCRARQGQTGGAPFLDRFLLRVVLFGMALALLGLMAARATQVQEIWLLPVVYLAGPLATLALLRRTGAGGGRALGRTIAGLAALVAVALGVHVRYGDPGNPALGRAPVEAIASEIEARFPGVRQVVAEPEWLAANLLYRRPDLEVATTLRPGPAPAAGQAPVLVLWERPEAERPLLSARLAARWGIPVALGPAVPLSAPFPPQPREIFEVEAMPLVLGGG